MYILYIQPENSSAAAWYKEQAASYLAKPYTERDAGFDLYSAEAVVEPKMGAKISQQTKAAVFDTTRNIFRAYWMLPRSSISKTPLRLANSVGLIDAGYRGTLIAAIDNIHTEQFAVKNGDRITQVANSDLLPWNSIEVVDVIPGGETLRGTGGFGSTGLSGNVINTMTSANERIVHNTIPVRGVDGIITTGNKNEEDFVKQAWTVSGYWE